MDNIDFTTLSADEFRLAILKMPPEKLHKAIACMTSDQIALTFSLFQEFRDPNWREKCRAAVAAISERPLLEAAGKAITPQQALDLLDHNLQVDTKNHWKLSPLLVGMPHEVFTSVILEATPKQFDVLKLDGLTEPVQHHLTVLVHALTHQVSQLTNTLVTLEKTIEKCDVTEFGPDEIANLQQTIEAAANDLKHLQQVVNKALGLAWNTMRADLIEGLSKVKENSQHLLAMVTAKPATAETPATGLQAKLEQRLYSVYGNPLDLNDIEALKDEEPAIEAIVKFKVWYLQDYWEIGLLPEIPNAAGLELSQKNHSEPERALHRANLFKKAQENLLKVGLSTVKDLKKARIFSRRTLSAYITENITKL